VQLGGQRLLVSAEALDDCGEISFAFTTVWLTLEQIQLVAVLLLFGTGLLLRKSL